MENFSFLFSFPKRAFLLALTCCLTVIGTSQSQTLPFQFDSKLGNRIPGQYIVIYKDAAKATLRTNAATTANARKQLMRQEASATLVKNKLDSKQITQVYETVVKGFAISGLTSEEASILRNDEQIASIMEDKLFFLSDGVTNAPAPMVEGCTNQKITINGVPNSAVGLAGFGTGNVVSGQVALVNNGTSTPTQACQAISNVLTGKIALIDRGDCNLSLKAYNAQVAGAIGVIIANDSNTEGAFILPPGENAGLVNIPVMSLSKAAGNAIKTALLNGVVTAQLDPGWGTQCKPWGVDKVRGGLTGVGTRAWIIDTGIDLDHPDLNVDAGLSISFHPQAASPDDQDGHGTHVAGTIAAKDNGIGVIGVAAGATIVAVRIFGPNSADGAPTSVIIAGMEYVADHAGPNDVVNMSFGGDIDATLDDAVFTLSQKCKVVIAAGNEARNANHVSPGRVNGSNVYTVSAIDITGKLATFSNFGSAPIDYAAPGVNITSCWLKGSYYSISGTSMATPHVVGLLLLGSICSESKATGDADGKPDPIAVHYDPLTAADLDNDGASICEGDPNDNDSSVFPGATDICGDGKDNDGDGLVDENCCSTIVNGIAYVKPDAGGANDGSSWGSAFTSLQSALSAAHRCSQITQIWVAKGTYYPSENEFGQTAAGNVRNKAFQMRNGLVIYGGFEGNELSNFNLTQRNLILNKTTLSGDIQKDNAFGNNAYHIFLNIPLYPNALDGTAILDGFTLTAGEASPISGNEDFTRYYGGGILNFNSSPGIRNCIFESNRSSNGGGAIFNYVDSNPAILNTSFFRNQASVGGYGGAIYNHFSSPTITNAQFQLNTTSAGSAILNFESNPVITNVSISGNEGYGAVFNINSHPVIKNSIIWGNSSQLVEQSPSSSSTVSYSMIPGPGVPTPSQNPRFVAQPVYGQPTLGNLALRDCSPAINAGDPATNPATVGNKDLAGNSRSVGPVIDIGAYEFLGTPVTFKPVLVADPGPVITEGQSATLTASGAASYLWSTSATTASIIVTPHETTYYYVDFTAGECTEQLGLTLSVNSLPVTLISFSAKKQSNGSIQLTWLTANEVDNAYFELERSTDLKNIELLAKVAADVIPAQKHTYQYTDELPYKGTSYYRLKQIDADGTVTNYNWVSIVSDQEYLAYPNPVLQNRFQLKVDEPEKAVLKCYGADGKLVPVQKVHRGDGILELKLPKSTAPGIYILQVEERAHSRQYRVMVNN